MSLVRFLKPAVTAREDETIFAVARLLREEHVGCVVVTRNGRPVGIITDRDVAIRVVADERNPRGKAADIMTCDPIVATADDEIETVAARMRKHGIRRLPIVDSQGILVGVVTADDLFILLCRELGDVGVALAEGADSDESR